MKRWSFIGAIIFLCLGLGIISGAQAAEKEVPVSTFSGVYQVTVTSDQGLSRTAQITIEELPNGRVRIDYDYEGSPFGLVGEVSGSAEEGGALCRFAVDYPRVVTAQGEFTIVRVAETYQLQGQGSGSYNYQGRSGQVAAQVTGFRVSPLAPADTAPLRTMAVVAGLVILIVIVASYRFLQHQPHFPSPEP